MIEQVNLKSALSKMAQAGGARYVSMFERGNIELEYYAPQGTDPQKPHTRDEMYFVISGSGVFVAGSDRRPFGPGEIFYVPAGIAHRFEEFSADFATWAIFVPGSKS